MYYSTKKLVLPLTNYPANDPVVYTLSLLNVRHCVNPTNKHPYMLKKEKEHRNCEMQLTILYKKLIKHREIEN